MLLPIAVVLAVCATLTAAAWIVWKLNRAVRPEAIDPGWWQLFTAEKYAPLGHLLDGSEFAFLEAQCGQNRSLVRRFRARRARIALEFLNEMRADFGRLQSIGMALVAAGRGTAGFEEELFRHRIRFTRNWWRVRSQVLLWQLGLGGVDVEGLLESMRISSSTVRAALQPAAYVS